MAYKRKTQEEKIKEIEELTASMDEQINSYFESPEKMIEHLKFMSNFYNYSPRNMALIDKQFQGAEAVGSFNFWKGKGVHVNKGEKGIKILVPTPVEYFKRGEDWVQSKYANKQEKEQLQKGQLENQKKLFFKVGYVFEYTQTNAREKGLTVSEIFGRYHKDGTLQNDKEMIAALNKMADKVGFKVLDQAPLELGTAKGAVYPNGKMIALNPRNTDFENVTTLIHELAHAKLHTGERREELTRSEREFQAEMVSYVVANHYAIDTEDFSLSYLAGWTKDKALNDKERLLKEVRETSSEFIDVIDNHFEQIELLKNNKKDYYDELLVIQENNGLTANTVEFDNGKFVSFLKENNPDDFIKYLNNKALYIHEQNNSELNIVEPVMYIHGISDDFEKFGEVNNRDFDKLINIEYTIAIPDEEKGLVVISNHYESDKYVHPLHHLDKENIVDKSTYNVLENSYHNVLLKNDEEYIQSIAPRIREILNDEKNVSVNISESSKSFVMENKKPQVVNKNSFEMER